MPTQKARSPWSWIDMMTTINCKMEAFNRFHYKTSGHPQGEPLSIQSSKPNLCPLLMFLSLSLQSLHGRLNSVSAMQGVCVCVWGGECRLLAFGSIQFCLRNCPRDTGHKFTSCLAGLLAFGAIQCCLRNAPLHFHLPLCA